MRFLAIFVMLAASAAWSADGRVYVTSEPDGANVYVVKTVNGNTTEEATPGATPLMVTLDVRVEPYELILRKDGFKEKRFSIQVGKAAIIKPPAQKMDPATRNVDVIYEEDGWQVFVDGKAVNDVEGNVAKTPCTIQLPEGAKDVAIAKEGFNDQNMKIGEPGNALEFKGKPWRGQSRVLQGIVVPAQSQNANTAAYVGTWEIPKFGTFIVTSKGKNYHLEQVGHFQSDISLIQDGKLAFSWPTKNPVAILFSTKDGKTYISCSARARGLDKSIFEATPIWEYEAAKKE